MRTLEDFRLRYASYADQELLNLLECDPETLTSEARQALAEESAHRRIDTPEGRAAKRVELATAVREPAEIIWRYPKARLGARFGASIIDKVIGMGPMIVAGIIALIFKLPRQTETTVLINLFGAIAWSMYYGLTKDGRPNGQSIGKKAVGLMVVNVKTNRPCNTGGSALRCFIGGLVGVVPVAGPLIEPIVVLAREDGRRLGDQAADTQVIEVDAYRPTTHPAGAD
ncbi:MAG TPA: RDD family protein [Gemmatimonadaceae bacterium]|jgi:uncharacterized RDD family membrane protein YckC